uniref:Uncharacterized protein n=1 Tax=Romanomermis culicivorax TaxID=13658 RepID=A0A915L6T1_ROMCU
MDDSFGQLQDRQDNTSFILSNCNVHRMIRSTDIFNFFSSLFSGPHSTIEDPMFLTPENIKAFIRADIWDSFRQDNIIVGFHIKEDITLILTKFGYLDQERELAWKQHDNIDYILSCCAYDLELVVGEMKDKAKTRLTVISPQALNLKELMMELLFLWADAFKISWGQLSSLEFHQLMDADMLNIEVLQYAMLDVRGLLLCFLALLRYRFTPHIQNCFQLFAHDMLEPELIANLAQKFPETFENKNRDDEWKGAYKTNKISDNTSALYFMMRGEAVATFKLAEEQAPHNFHCPPHFSNSYIEFEPVPQGWYPWIERKVKTPKKKKNYNEDGEIMQNFAGFHYQAHAFIRMKLGHEFNARQA